MAQKNKELLETLNKEIETRILPKTNYPYVPASAIRSRLNEAFGALWNTEIIKSEVVGDEIVLLQLRLVAELDNNERIVKEAFGSAIIQKYSSGPNKGKIINLGDSYNNAVTDAIKACAKQLGISNTQLDVVKDPNSGEYVQVSDFIKTERPEKETNPQTEKEIKTTSKEKVLDLKKKLAEKKEKIATRVKTSVKKEDKEEDIEETTNHGFDYSEIENKTDSPKNTQKLVIINLAKMQKMDVEDYIKGIIGVSKTVDELTFEEAGKIVRSGFITAFDKQ